MFYSLSLSSRHIICFTLTLSLSLITSHHMFHINSLSLATGRWFSPVSCTNKTDRHDITEILLLKVALNTITITSLSHHMFSRTVHKLVCLMVFNATFNNISVISWRSVLMVEETTDLS